ncbi:MAG: hypothetical protein VX191_00615 [Candidatus Thermoplasmatota archaeon]|nr:hypothetical protein [Candidatus Thermoplasmatota archaeon]
MVSEEATWVAIIIGLGGLAMGEVRAIFRTFYELISRPFPKFNKYLGMTKVEYDLNVDSHNRKQWLSWTRIVLLVSIVVFELWMVYAWKFSVDDPLQWIANRGGVPGSVFQCGCCWLFLMFGFFVQEKFPTFFEGRE